MAKCKLLVVGVGSIGQRHVRCFLNTERVEVAICESNESLRNKIAGQYDVTRSYANLDDALTDQHDAAVIAVPAQMHVPMAIRLAEADIHLLIEKPLSTSLDRVAQLQQLIGQRELVAAVAYVYRANPVLGDMKKRIDEGLIGKPVQLVATCGQHFPTYRPAYRDIYYTRHETGGGAIQDALTHIINAGEWLVGPTESLLADADHQVLADVTVEDTVHLLTRHHDQVMGCYSLNQYQSAGDITITVVGDKGTARFEHFNNRWRWMLKPDSSWEEFTVGELPRDAFFILQANSFLDAVAGKAQPLCSLEEGTQTLKVNLAALQSAQDQNKFLQIDGASNGSN